MPSYDLQVRSIVQGSGPRSSLDVRWDPVPSGTGLATQEAATGLAAGLPTGTTWRVMRRSEDPAAYDVVVLVDPATPLSRQPTRVRAADRTRPRGR
jgi:hypothetical protein